MLNPVSEPNTKGANSVLKSAFRNPSHLGTSIRQHRSALGVALPKRPL
jgi:hypothetical protein